jgi:hypothetical protein
MDYTVESKQRKRLQPWGLDALCCSVSLDDAVGGDGCSPVYDDGIESPG